MFSKIIILFTLIFSMNSYSSWDSARDVFENGRKSQKLRSLIIELVDGKFYYSAMPLMKEYLIKETRVLDGKVEVALSKMIRTVGIKQFETLPFKYLLRSKSNNIRYILAKKYLRKQNYAKALIHLSKIPRSHSIYPFAKNMEGTILSIKKNTSRALTSFNECISSSNSKLSSNNRRLVLNRDYCISGLARTNFGAKNYKKTDLLYLDIPKSSMIWPEILFEEAWNSYYQKNYNRTLGKLVSYKAPVFDHMFNPEIEVLSALSYLKLCLYSDAKKISNNFYKDYLKDARRLRSFIKKNKKRYKNYYDLMMRYEQFGRSSTPLMKTLLKSVQREEVFRDIKLQLGGASSEYNQIRRESKSRFKRFVIQNLNESLRTQKKIAGAYIRAKLVSFYAQLYKAFEGMSYIKLEVLAQRKAKLYSFDEKGSKRGDIKFIKRNEKQYFWDFNGEFWADELGDYVFALKSEC